MSKKLKVGIIGAGIQGISNALFLQKKDMRYQFLTRMSLEVQQLHTEMQDTFLHMHHFH